MNLSLDEYRALVAKAFRGVGYSWGLTEDASWAARRLAEVDAQSPAAVVAMLDYLEQSGSPMADHESPATTSAVLSRMPAADWTCTADALCPVCVGTALLDSGRSALDERLTLGPTLTAELLAPFCAQLLGSDPAVLTIDWESGDCRVSQGSLVFSGNRSVVAPTVTISKRMGSDPARDAGSDPTPRTSRVVVDPLQFQRLEALAHRIYAPATEESRAGAGAGTTDND